MPRKTTSAIKGYTVADVRCCLNNIRSNWISRDDKAFHLSSIVNLDKYDDTIGTFSQKFVMGCHLKRHHKNKKKY